MARKKRSERVKKPKGKGLFGGFFRNIIKKDNMDDDITTVINETLNVSPDNSLTDAFSMFTSGGSSEVETNPNTTKSFMGLESKKKNEKKTNMIIIIAGAVIVLLYLFMKKK